MHQGRSGLPPCPRRLGQNARPGRQLLPASAGPADDDCLRPARECRPTRRRTRTGWLGAAMLELAWLARLDLDERLEEVGLGGALRLVVRRSTASAAWEHSGPGQDDRGQLLKGLRREARQGCRVPGVQSPGPVEGPRIERM